MLFYNTRTTRIVLLTLLSSHLLCNTSAKLHAEEILVTSGPTITMRPNSPLSAVLEFSTNIPTRAGLNVRGANESWTVDMIDPLPAQTNHTIPLLGFAPDSQYDIGVTVNSNGSSLALPNSLSVTTGPLPDDFPLINVLTSQPNRMEPGYTLFPIRSGNRRVNYSAAVDAQGTVRWYIAANTSYVHRRPDGTLLGSLSNTISEMDFLGNVLRSWYATGNPPDPVPPGSIPVPVSRFHHDASELPNGNFITLDTITRTVENYPTSETDPEAPRITAQVLSDPVIEFSPDGTLVSTWDQMDVLDPTRIGYGAVDGHRPNDWGHTNTVWHDPVDDSLIISVRHQDAVIKVSRSTGDLIWILGPHKNWTQQFQQHLLTPKGDDFEWPYHTHAPMVLPNGHILVFDNHNFGASPFDTPISVGDSISRAVEFAVDEQTMEVTQVWEWDSSTIGERLYSGTGGDADWLSATDNVLITYNQRGRIIEVQRDGQAVFDIALDIPDETQNVYRSERIPSLYPPGYHVVIPEPSTIALLGAVTLFSISSQRRQRLRVLAS